MIAIVLSVAVALAIVALLVYLTRARGAPVAAVLPATRWTDAAGEEFSELSESGRCEMIFALAALDDAGSLVLLERALDDSSETVALAAAHALASRGGAAQIAQYLDAHPGARTARLAHALALLEGGASLSS